ncbi:hypothetical protein EW146_g3576 [Bondarzewia mesenterica]|uniref:Peptidase S1 domain-containing protein n=1 Tax=Bondarzewia mesenterica TaxID=1095465 RepID=A0A4V3XFE7_9AGAM|nr:hypothetical protein EW146_g3576 [Bondarzewia mesenterica]
MSSDQDSKSTIVLSMIHHTVPDPPNNAPYVPSKVEAKHYLYGLPSNPCFIARSSPDIWVRPTGPEAYLDPKELAPLGPHGLNSMLWEGTVGPAMEAYLCEKQVKCSFMNPLRIGIAGQPSPSAVILVSIDPGTLAAEDGIEYALHCRSILVQNGINDMHVIIYESKSSPSAMMYKPAISANPAAIVCEPFATTVGITICKASTTNLEGTGGFFFIDTAKPGILYLLTARHILFHPDNEKNELYQFRENSGQPKRKVLLMGEATFVAHCKAIEAAIGVKQIVIAQLNRRLEMADRMEDEEDAALERKAVKPKMKEANEAIAAFEKVLADVTREWAEEESRVIGHVTLSPPIGLADGEDGFTDDWAVVQIYPSMIAKLNFIGNAIDLGSVEIDELTAWMYPDPATQSSFKYPGDRLLRFSGTVSDQEMYRPDPRNKDHDNDPAIMVLKNGNSSNLTVGRLNTIRAFSRVGETGKMSKELSVLPRNSKSGPFSFRGDSGSVVVDGTGRACGILTGGDGATDVSDCTFVTSINFLIKRLAAYDIHANIFPLPANL